MLYDASGKPIKPESIKLESGHFATAMKAQDFRYLLSILPDPDPILKRKGIEIKALRDLLVDGKLSSDISIRFSAVSGDPWAITQQADDELSVKAHDAVVQNFNSLNIPFITDEMMEHILYGFKPVELIWSSDEKYWYLKDIVGKPTEWFTWNKDNQMVFKKGFADYEDLPDFKFISIQHRASYNNPFGEKLLSKCFWPCTFKKNGWMWWTNFVEKYGSAFLFGTYPLAQEAIKEKLLNALSDMISDAVAAVPEGTNIEIKEATGKANSSTVYQIYKQEATNEITWTILGQLLTTGTGDTGSYAQAKVHDLVRKDLNYWDKTRISQAYNKIIEYFTFFNFGIDAVPSKFVFLEEEDVKKEKAECDEIVFRFSGHKPTKKYLMEKYNFKEDDIEENNQLTDLNNPAGFQKVFKMPYKNIFKQIKSYFANKPKITKEDKLEIKNHKIINDFAGKKSKDFQYAVNKIIDSISDDLQTADNYDDVFNILIKKHPELEVNEITKVMDEIQYCAGQVGAFTKKNKKVNASMNNNIKKKSSFPN